MPSLSRRLCRAAVLPVALTALALAPVADAQTTSTPAATPTAPAAAPGVVPCAALDPEDARRLCPAGQGVVMAPGAMMGQVDPGDMPHYRRGGGDWGWDNDDDWTASDTVMTILMTLLLVLLLAAVVLLARRGHHGPPAAPPAETPLAVLERRLAHGEIDEEEYARRRAALERTS